MLGFLIVEGCLTEEALGPARTFGFAPITVALFLRFALEEFITCNMRNNYNLLTTQNTPSQMAAGKPSPKCLSTT